MDAGGQFMTFDNWDRVQELFLSAADLPADKQRPFLEAACDGDSALCSEVESLLASDRKGGEGIQTAVEGEASAMLDSHALDGQLLGPYRVLREIGRGGMGAVYLAARDHPYRKEVAIKVVKRGMDTDDVLRRFRSERQILANLEHPYIARLIDGGATDDGRPFLAMEFVGGQPIDQYCDARHLSIAGRCRLFLKVCEAVAHAHQNLVIHRDLKPSNIFITADGNPKLLDFGLARILDNDADTDVTAWSGAGRRLTPEYASPEQVRGTAISTATDIYSLGVVLHELLTGLRPHRITSVEPGSLEKAICETEIRPPSAALAGVPGKERAGKDLRGDLDNIVMKALQRDPARRYHSVERFSEDILCYLEGLPVLARPDSAIYRMSKFARRHWVGLGATAAVIAALSAGVAISMHEARLANERFELVRVLANRFLFDFYSQIVNVPGTTKAQQTVVNTAVEYLDKLGRTAGSDPALWQDMAEAYRRLANVQGGQTSSHASRYEDALLSQQRSVEFYRKLAARDPAKRQNLAVALQRLARIELILRHTNSAFEHTRESARLFDTILATNSTDGKVFWDAASVYNTMALDLNEAERPDEALAANLKAQQYQAHAENPSAFHGNWRTAVFQQNEAKIRMDLGDVDGGIALLERVLRLLDEMALGAPNHRELSSLIDGHLAVLAESFCSLDSLRAEDPRKASALYERHLESARKLLNSDPADRLAGVNMAVAESESATPWIELDPRRAIDLCRSALARWDDLLKDQPEDEYAMPVHARARMRLALALVRAGRPREAIEPSAQAVETFRQLRAKNRAEAQYSRNLVFALAISADAMAAAKRDPEARQFYAEAAELGEQLRTREHASLSHTFAAAYAFDRFGTYWMSRGDRAQARQWFERTRQAWTSRTEKTPAVQRKLRQAEERLHGV
jgi:serine/threonine protein kinase